MELDNYRNFLAIIEAGSFTGAADYVHIAQPALSKQLRALENYFGTKLIITTRGSRQILLTEAGRVLYQKAKYMCALEDLAKSEIENIMGGCCRYPAFQHCQLPQCFIHQILTQGFLCSLS